MKLRTEPLLLCVRKSVVLHCIQGSTSPVCNLELGYKNKFNRQVNTVDKYDYEIKRTNIIARTRIEGSHIYINVHTR